MQKSEFELVVSPGRLPLGYMVLAGVFFTAALYYIYDAGMALYHFGFSEDFFQGFSHDLYYLCFCIGGGLQFGIVKEVLIDTDKDMLISRYCIGPFSYDHITTVPVLEYVAVFSPEEEEFQINLWYKGNRHYKMYCLDTKEPAMKFAMMVATRLNIDLLDATVKNNSQWIDKPFPTPM